MKEKNSRSCIHSVWEAGKATEIYDIVPLFNISDHVIGSIYKKIYLDANLFIFSALENQLGGVEFSIGNCMGDDKSALILYLCNPKDQKTKQMA